MNNENIQEATPDGEHVYLDEITYLFKKCAMARYSPQNVSELTEDVNRTKDLILNIQKEN